MKIERSNYEIWLIDWLDGNLNDVQVEALKLFLNENPDLKKEAEELTTFTLYPATFSFPGKNTLKKTAADITESQFEFLCVGYLENDLSVTQEKELFEIINNDSEKEKMFELIQKTKLTALNINYPYKKQLIKRAFSERLIRYSVIGLSAAATVALIITSYLVIPHNQTDPGRDGLQSVSILTIDALAPDNNAENKNTIPIIIPDTRRDGSLSVSTRATDSPAIDNNVREPQFVPTIIHDTIGYRDQSVPANIEKTFFKPRIDLKTITVSNSLMASQIIPSIPQFDEERSNVGRFLAKNFRKAFMKEKSPAKIFLLRLMKLQKLV